MKKLVLTGAPLLLLALLLAAFNVVQGTPEFTDASAPGWSRGRLLGHASLVNPVALLPDPQGGAQFVWVVGNPPNAQRLNYAQVNANGDVVLSQPLALPQSQPESPVLVAGAEGNTSLFYLSAGGDDLKPLERALYLARIDNTGKVLETARASAPQHPVRTYAVAAQSGSVYHIYYSGDDAAPGVQYACYMGGASITPCAPSAQPQPSFGVLGETATKQAVHVDEQGRIHLAWFKQRTSAGSGVYATELYYTLGRPDTEPNKAPAFEHETKVIAFRFASGVDLKPPQIATDQTHVYIAWVQDERGGRGNLGAQAYYVSFPIGQPASLDEPQPLNLPPTAKVKYESLPGSLLAALAPAAGGSDYVNDVQLLSGPQVVGVALLGLTDKQRAPVQVAAFAFEKGKIAGFQIVNDSLTQSNQPAIALDASGHLQLAWLDSESGDQYAVRYASTDPHLVARWGQLGLRDVAARASNALWFELSFLPWIVLSVPWLFLPLAVLIVRIAFGSDESLASRATRIALVLAIAVHLVVKSVLLPPLPADWSPLARIAFMAALPLLGLLAMALYVRRERYASSLVAYLIFAAVDVFTALFIWMPVASM